MVQIVIPQFNAARRRTRTYDVDSTNVRLVLNALVQNLPPVGAITPTFAATEPNDAWKLLNGQTLLRDDYPDLYGVLSASLGGNLVETATTFDLPDVTGRMPIGIGGGNALADMFGANSVTISEAQLPSHSHTVTDAGHTHTFTGTPHSHAITDPEHAHGGVLEPGTSGGFTGSGDADYPASTDTAPTGITVDGATAAGTNSNEGTGISIAATGGGEAVDITPKGFGTNWLIKT